MIALTRVQRSSECRIVARDRREKLLLLGLQGVDATLVRHKWQAKRRHESVRHAIPIDAAVHDV